MRVARLILLFLIFVAIPTALLAQQPAQPIQRDPQAVQLLYQTFVSMGGLQKAQIADVRVEGTLASPGAPEVIIGTFVAKVRGWDISMDTIRNGELASYRVLKGAGSFRAHGQTKPLAPYTTNGLSLDLLPLFSRWTDFLQVSTSVRLTDQVSLDGIPCFLIRVEVNEPATDLLRKNEHGKTDVFVDSRTGLVAAIRFQATLGPESGDKVEVENRFTDFVDYAGLLIPKRITHCVSGYAVRLLQIQSVRFNNGFTDADFRN